ncbi:MAG: SUMF1/EgtB/PvdO family nonheme iron enzyme [Chthoniobacter sp.]|nr:SUMF1/EgtB/PvdO family nonheme iron enzyme [Chthoniobacter sp.]
MVRVIGRGSYGEIWLARSLTGTWRAVKIVDRRTFESDKAFLREFEGMSKFEPISRGDAGFVDILHVGREEGGHFFYYVMELADDHLAGGRIDPENYAPKTLKSELARRARLLTDECVTIGLSLSRALGVLHAQGLVHRDIKPANVIFVGGVPKIADIGLVAASGGDSFVGTEGYVPPEGPGSVQADIYSLGKVLYEIAMGKDRMEFPSVCTRLDELPDKGALLQLNEVLLRACANDPAGRYASAEELHEDLVRLRDGRPLAGHARRRWPLLASVGAAVALLAAGWHFSSLGAKRGGVLIETEPPGAMVVLDGRMKRAPAQFAELPVGRHSAHVMLTGYKPVDTAFEIRAATEAHPAKVRLAQARGAAALASRPVGAAFELRQGEVVVKSGTTPATLADLAAGAYQVRMRLDGRERTAELEIKRGETAPVEMEFATGRIAVTSTPPGAEIFADGRAVGTAPVELALAEGAHDISARYRSWPEQKRSVQADHQQAAEAAFEFAGGSVKITSSPGGATVFAKGEEQGRTPLLLEDLEPGRVNYEIRLEGFKNLEVSGDVQPGGQTFIPARFVQRAGPTRGQPWENSLGMKFAPVGEVLVGIWPVRVRDFEAFCSGTARAQPVADFPQTATHPAVRIHWEDATSFCDWLTARELAVGRLETSQRYRLPTDKEWSAAAGLPDEGGETPEQRDGKTRDFPWGKQWPPPAGTGNFADGPSKRGGVIAGYRDGFPQTSPVGSFAANRAGLFDMTGNVWQWCADSYKGGTTGAHDWGVLRGGSWGTAAPAELRSSYRNVVDRSERDVIFGFRCVLDPGPGS